MNHFAIALASATALAAGFVATAPVGAHADTLVTHHAEWAMFPNTLATFEFIASPHDKLVVTVMPDNGTVSINKGPEYPIGGLFGYGQHVQNEFGHVHLENTLGEVKAGWMTIIHAVGKWNMVNKGPSYDCYAEPFND